MSVTTGGFPVTPERRIDTGRRRSYPYAVRRLAAVGLLVAVVSTPFSGWTDDASDRAAAVRAEAAATRAEAAAARSEGAAARVEEAARRLERLLDALDRQTSGRRTP